MKKKIRDLTKEEKDKICVRYKHCCLCPLKYHNYDCVFNIAVGDRTIDIESILNKEVDL